MVLALYRRLYGLKCPTCAALQPVLALEMTFKGGFARAFVNAHTYCVGCKQRLRLAPRYERAETIAFQICIAILCLVFGVVTVGAAIGLMPFLFGVWGFLVLPICLVAVPLLIAFIIGHASPLYRKVIVV